MNSQAKADLKKTPRGTGIDMRYAVAAPIAQSIRSLSL
jgi:hypothetical protein